MSLPKVDNSYDNRTLPSPYVTSSVDPLNHTLTDAELLQHINDRKAALLLPDILVIVLFLLLGLLGNPLAIYIYGWRWQSSSTKVFLFSLAVIDLLNCLITIPTEIISMRNYYNFPSDGWCKVSRFTTYVMNNATVVIFLSIAVDRYIRICHPYRSAVSARSAKVACGIGVVIGFIVAWPALFLYGKVEILVPDESTPPRFVTGSMCMVHNGMEQYSLAFFVYLCSACFVCTLILVILYTFIGRAILKRKRLARMRKETTATTLENLGGAKNGSVNGSRSLQVPHSVSPTPPSSRVMREASAPPEEETIQGCNVQTFSFHCKKLRPPKATLMLFLITVVFVTSFLPFLIISIIRHHRGPAFYLGLSSREQIVVNIFIRSYIVNNCTNPIVYGLCNSLFRKECKRLYRSWCARAGSNVTVTSSNNSRHNSIMNRSKTLYETPKLERKVSPEP